MSIEKETRLNKVAKELSVGVGTIVDFLMKKGFTVDNNPNSKITAKQYELLQREYASDQMAKKLSEREAEIEKERKRAINAENKANKAANANQVSSSDQKEVKASDQNQRQNNNQKPQNQQRNDKHRQKYQEPAIPKVIGKIDLSTLNTKTRPDKKSSSSPSGQEKPRQQPPPVQQQQQPQQPKPDTTAQNTTPQAPAKTPEPVVADIDNTASQSANTEIFRPGMVQLSGPRILGKIELEDSRKKKKRSRRKRIDKERVDINAAVNQEQPSTQPADHGGKKSGKKK
ncbi:MAG: hypothetical protein IJ894_01090, partial [Bacteroidales bacterium]|nr:hypothetical protein [Bacteroidales bacterium]